MQWENIFLFRWQLLQICFNVFEELQVGSCLVFVRKWRDALRCICVTHMCNKRDLIINRTERIYAKKWVMTHLFVLAY